jgi:hypothetical protein
MRPSWRGRRSDLRAEEMLTGWENIGSKEWHAAQPEAVVSAMGTGLA